MISALALSYIARHTGGRLIGDAVVESVSTDSRQAGRGDLFVALVGENFDGNDYVAQVAEAGASAAVVSKPNAINLPQIQVEDTRLALGLIARINRRLFRGPLIALTGSAGKTTCKEMIASILRNCGEVLATEGNFNNEIGVPLTLLALSAQHRFAVVEMGASRANDIQYLAQFAEPNIALLTNAMAVHLEGFGNLETIVQSKGQILESVAAGGTAIINIDQPFTSQWRQQAGTANIITFSQTNADADFYGRDIQLQNNGETSFVLCLPQTDIAINLSLLGEHNIINAVAAAAAATAAGASPEQVKAGLESVRPAKGRLQSHQLEQQLLIDDSYNANPDSVKAAIDVLANFSGRRCLILGTMAELGPQAQQKHRDIAAYAKSNGIERLYIVGEFAQQAAQVFGQAFASMEQLLATFDDGLDVDVILIKGSRSAAMERAVEALINNNNMRGER